MASKKGVEGSIGPRSVFERGGRGDEWMDGLVLMGRLGMITGQVRRSTQRLRESVFFPPLNGLLIDLKDFFCRRGEKNLGGGKERKKKAMRGRVSRALCCLDV